MDVKDMKNNIEESIKKIQNLTKKDGELIREDYVKYINDMYEKGFLTEEDYSRCYENYKSLFLKKAE